ncbi:MULTISPECIES: GerAB/ArcD/ProY family transporter [Paenibacillus]|uniref:Spore germination protein KB n=1 Tax=Paenibacillus lactis TaxID=228574 RepID=A0ABS4FDH1_9BACL|nr:GerAB/ArcD/ProY family transporter [Paenibacillus lactis]MBP1894295.1 spore germination protein KB [Paenibacillus lactis]MCM3497575.1 spore germination protein [Paenibacillus lactis]HAF99530.1 spore gernimation protein [Paenibacillus lactis]
MEKVKISPFQFFSILVLFQFGTTLVVNLGLEAGRDAWIAVLIGTVIGMLIFSLNAYLYTAFPDKLPVEYYRLLLGKYVGSLVGLVYAVLYMFTAARDLVDGGLLVMASAALRETPLLIVNLLMIMAVAYVLHQGLEVLARTATIFLAIMFMIGVFSGIVILFSGIIDLQLLLPVMGEGFQPILESVLKKNIHFPFGELICATAIFPAVNHTKNGVKAGLLAILVTGVILAHVSLITISVLGADITERAVFPLLTMMGKVEISEFIERTQILIVMVLIIGVFFKISLYYYAALISSSILFKIPYRKLIYPYALVILGLSIILARSYSEHLMKGGAYLYTVFPFYSIGLPLLLVIICLIRKAILGRRSGSAPGPGSGPASGS